MAKALEDVAGRPVDIKEAEERAKSDMVAQREEALAKQLAEMRSREQKLVDPLQFEMSIQAENFAGYVLSFGWGMSPPPDKQVQSLERRGIRPDEIEYAGKVSLLLDRLAKWRSGGLTTPKQIHCLEQRGFRHVGQQRFEETSHMIDRVTSQRWEIPASVTPSVCVPVSMGGQYEQYRQGVGSPGGIETY